MIQYFPKPFKSFGGKKNVKGDLSNYATKTDLENVTQVENSSFALKTNLASLKIDVDKLDIDKLAPVPVNLSKLIDVVKNDVVKETVYDNLVAYFQPIYHNKLHIDTNDFVLKANYNADKTKLENKIPHGTDFVKKAKLTELENKIPDISNLATKTALTAVENKIPDVSNLVKKTDYNTKVTVIENKLNSHNHDKYITTPKFDTLAADVFNTRLAQANLIAKTDLDAELSRINRKINENKTKQLLVENEMKKLKAFNLRDFIGKGHFEKDGTQNYSIFQPLYKYFTFMTGTPYYISSWKSKGLSTESTKPPTTSDNILAPALSYYGVKTRVKLTGSCLKH